MKRLGIILIAFASLFTLSHFLFPNLSFGGVWWQTALILIGVFASRWLPAFPTFERMKWHWKVALFFATLCSFMVVFGLVLKVLPVSAQDYSLAITSTFFGLIAILFDFLDKRTKDLP